MMNVALCEALVFHEFKIQISAVTILWLTAVFIQNSQFNM